MGGDDLGGPVRWEGECHHLQLIESIHILQSFLIEDSPSTYFHIITIYLYHLSIFGMVWGGRGGRLYIIGIMTRGVNDASRVRVQLSSTRTQKLEFELD